MEKSMVHQLNSLTHSTVFTTRASFINTHFGEPQFHEMRKSRIQNLPNHKKQDLSGKLNFIVVFQTIEIQRLSQEIETLRVKLKDYQRQIFNYQSYQIQIRELTERCYMFQTQREGYEEQLDKMKMFCENLYHQFEEYKSKYGEAEVGLKEKYSLEKERNTQLALEIEKWRARYASAQKAKAKQLEEMKLMMESQRKSTLNREIKELTTRYESEINQISNELRKSREQSSYRFAEVRRLSDVLMGFEVRAGEMKEIQEKMYDYENKFVMLSQENYRLNELLRWRNEEIEKLKNGQKQLRGRLQSIKVYENQNEHLKEQVRLCHQQMQQLTIRISRIDEDNQRLTLQQSKIKQYQKLADRAEAEIQKLNNLIHQKIQESDHLKNTTKILQSRIHAMNNATQKQFNTYQEKIVKYTVQSEKLNQQLKARLTEIQNWKGRCGQLEKSVSMMEQMGKDRERLEEQLRFQIRSIEQYKGKIRLMEESMSIMDELEEKFKIEQNMKKELLGERDMMNNAIRGLNGNILALTEKNNSLLSELERYSNVQIEINEYHLKIKSMTQQIERIYGEIHQRVTELNQLKEHIKTLGNNKVSYQGIEEKLVSNLRQMEGLILQLDETRRQNDRYQLEMSNQEQMINKMQSEMMAINQEKYTFTNTINQKTQELNQAYHQIEQMSAFIGELRGYENRCQHLEKKLEMTEQAYRQMESRFKNETKKSQEFSIEIEKLSTQIIQLRSEPRIPQKLTQDLLLIKRQCQDKDMMIISLKKRIDVIEQMLSVVKNKMVTTHKQSHELANRMFLYVQKLDSVDALNQMLQRYEDQINRLNEQNLNLEGKSKLDQFDGIEMVHSVQVMRDDERQELPMVRQFSPWPTTTIQTINTEADILKRQISAESTQIANNSETVIVRQTYYNPFEKQGLNRIESKGQNTKIISEQVKPSSNDSFGRSFAASKIQYVSSVNNSPSNMSLHNRYIGNNITILPTQNEPTPSIPKSPSSNIRMYYGNSYQLDDMKKSPSYTILSPTANQDIPTVRILQPTNFQNIVNSTNATRTIRIVNDRQ